MKCSYCGQEAELLADRLSIHGMYDMHLFHKIHGKSVDELIDNWRKHIAEPIPAMVGDRNIDDMGVSWFCPVIVLSGETEVRRVGKGIFADYKTRAPRSEDDVNEFRQALLDDPDITRLLATAKNTE
jgi:hypothetical protein